MPQQIALLRGINVGGRNKLKMADLRELLANNEFKNVSTYIQSGNILFRNRRSNSSNAATIKSLIVEHYGYEVPVLVCDAKKLARIAAGNPFGDSVIDQLHVTLLASKPKAKLVTAASQLEFGSDQFKIVGDVAYVHCPNGYGKTKLNNGFFESKLNTTATTRNWKTLNKLIELAGAE